MSTNGASRDRWVWHRHGLVARPSETKVRDSFNLGNSMWDFEHMVMLRVLRCLECMCSQFSVIIARTNISKLKFLGTLTPKKYLEHGMIPITTIYGTSRTDV